MKQRTENLLVQEMAGETMVYDLETDKAYCLNDSLSAVWQACEGAASADDIRVKASAILNKDVNNEVVYLAVEQLNDNNLLSGFDADSLGFPMVSRRSMIKKAGLAAAVALPMITMLVAPDSAQAQSTATCVPAFGSCSVPGPPCCPGIFSVCVGATPGVPNSGFCST